MNDFTPFILMLSTLLIACVGTDVGNPADGGDGDFSFGAQPSQLSAMPGGLLVSDVDIQEAWINIGSIELRADCSKSNAETIEGPFAVDLLSANSIPAEFTQADYCAIRFELEPHENDTAGTKRSLMVRGIDSDGRSFTVESFKPDTLRFVGRGQRIDTSAEKNAFIVNLPLYDWIVAGGLTDLSDPVLVSEDENVNYLRSFTRAYQANSRLYKDANQSGSIEPQETPPVAVPESE